MKLPRPFVLPALLVMLCLPITAYLPSLSAQSTAELAPQVKPAIDGVLDLFKQKPVVVLGDWHGLAQQEDFYSALIRDPRFAEQVGNVVVEFGGESSQAIIDRYVSGEDVSITELRRVWTETCGFVPGPTSLGYVNFYANVRAANQKLPAEHRIKVWLGDPKIDWSKINSFQDLLPCLGQRDDNYLRIISEEILKKHKKTLLIIGTGHLFGPQEAELLSSKINKAYPDMLATVMPFSGYIEAECNAKVVAQMKDRPVPTLAGPIEGTRLKSQLQLPGCNYFTPDQLERMKATPGTALPPGVSEADLIHKVITAFSGEDADAILYLGPPDTLTQSPFDPNIYLDLEYFKEEDRRLRCCTPPPGGRSLDWDQLLQRKSTTPFPSGNETR